MGVKGDLPGPGRDRTRDESGCGSGRADQDHMDVAVAVAGPPKPKRVEGAQRDHVVEPGHPVRAERQPNAELGRAGRRLEQVRDVALDVGAGEHTGKGFAPGIVSLRYAIHVDNGRFAKTTTRSPPMSRRHGCAAAG